MSKLEDHQNHQSNNSVQKLISLNDLEIMAKEIIENPEVNRRGKDRSAIRRGLNELIKRLFL